MPETTDECKTCGNTFGWHADHNSVHPFNDGQAGATAFLGPRRNRDDKRDGKTPQRGAETASPVAWPFDPVLRQALIDKGVLTPDDLRAAEDKIRAVSAQFMTKGVVDGQ